jgi:O-acetyl-ADP-ribose deacetylase (regulator of RNase III)
MDFPTKSGIKASVYKTDITRLPVEAIVNAANESLLHGGGVAYAISRAAGYEFDVESREYVVKNGPLKVSEVVATTAGNLPCKKVLHAVGPRWADYKDKGLCEKVLADTVYNCLMKADSMDFTSLGIPSISSGITGFLSLCQYCTLTLFSASD